MTKFKTGDIVIYTTQICEGAVQEITLGQEYVIAEILEDGCVALEGRPKWEAWDEQRFTLKGE